MMHKSGRKIVGNPYFGDLIRNEIKVMHGIHILEMKIEQKNWIFDSADHSKNLCIFRKSFAGLLCIGVD